MEVKTMVAIEVAIAIFSASSAPTPCAARMAEVNGTRIIPPPMPSSPAMKPPSNPSSASRAMDIGSRGMAACSGQ